MNVRTIHRFGLIAAALLLPLPAFADAGWATLLIAASPIQFWYIAALSIVIEAGVLHVGVKTSIRKSLLISLAANIASYLVGILVGIYGFLGLAYLLEGSPGIVNFLGGSFFFSYLFMFALTMIVEYFLIKTIWKPNARRLLLSLLIGNALTYLLMFAYMTVFVFYVG